MAKTKTSTLSKTRSKAPRPASDVKIKGYLLHLTHYDPAWLPKKSKEKRFDLDVAHEVVEAVADIGFNTLLIGVSDGVVFASHPELKRKYSAPMKDLVALAEHARQRGLEIIPKLNFSKSPTNAHDFWSRAPGEVWHTHFDDDYYFQRGFDVIDEIIAACKPRRYFHVGMDEDHERSIAQYIAAILRLRAGLKKRQLRTVCWSDSGIWYESGAVHRERSMAAEEVLPRDCVRLLWNYSGVPTQAIKTIASRGYELWGAPGAKPEQIKSFRAALLKAGGTGLVMTHWKPCRKPERAALLERIQTAGPLY